MTTSPAPAAAVHAPALPRAQDIEQVLLRDRPRLRERLHRLQRRGSRHPVRPAEWAALQAEIDHSCRQVAARRARVPHPTYPDDLPIAARRAEIAAALRDHQAVIVAGETGSGKTTQLPKICLELGRGVVGQIGHTQPRRLAARSVATRIAEELGAPLGDLVGYQVRFQARGHPDALLRLMTDGILLQELQRDRLLLRYDTLIIDEAHERSLNIDFLLGYLQRLLPRRPELKLIITSATIDTARFASHFAGAPVVEVTGRTWPVEVRYRPLAAAAEEEHERDQAQAIVAAVDELAHEPGDILVFLPGERDIRETAEALRKHHPAGCEVLPLYARLSADAQARIFAPGTRRRVVLATNVAETSLTVPGIRHVIDTGLARISRYDARAQVQRLPIEAVARASADQRKGRCGRLGPGICIRLYAGEEYAARPAYTDPEILRTSLAAVILQMQAHRLGRIESFPFIDAPEPRLVRDGYRQLVELGALDAHHRLTETGRQLARLPLDPQLGRMLLAADTLDCLAETLVIVAALAVQDPRDRPHEARRAADTAHAEFADPRSDFIGFLNLWQAWQAQQRQLSRKQLGKWCRAHFLGYLRMLEWQETVRQLDHLVRDMGLHPNTGRAPDEHIHQALLAGLLNRVARRDHERIYHGPHGRVLQLFPGSVLAAQPPPWIVAAELVETRRLYARTAAPVRPRWIERLAGARVRREYLEPHWSTRRGQVIAYERVTFHGLLLVARRRVDFGPLDPCSAREIFIRIALIDGRFDTPAPFLRHNLRLVAEIEALEAKHRRRDLLVGEAALYRFYADRLPAEVYDRRTFAAWWQRQRRSDPRLLHMERAALLAGPLPQGTREAYPDTLQHAGLSLPLEYRFAPAEAADGVCVTLPVAALGRLPPERLEWLVPGLLREKLEHLLRALPKALRRHCVPVPETAALCLAELRPGAGPLLAQLGRALLRLRGVTLPDGAWDGVQLPAHLTLHLRIVDGDGRELAQGDDLAVLQRQLADAARVSVAAEEVLPAAPDEPLTAWTCGSLPERVTMTQAGVEIALWPALVDRGDAVDRELFDTPHAARSAHRRGLRRLFLLQLERERRALHKRFRARWALAVRFAPAGGAAALCDDLALAAVDRLCVDPEVRDAAAFAARLERARPRFAAEVEQLADEADTTLEIYHRLRFALDAPADGREVLPGDIREQLDALVYPGFVSQTPPPWRARLPYYLAALERRIERWPSERDRARAALVTPWWQRLRAWRSRHAHAADDAELVLFRWMIEEYRVSLFAQELRTALPISARRLERQWQRLAGSRG